MDQAQEIQEVVNQQQQQIQELQNFIQQLAQAQQPQLEANKDMKISPPEFFSGDRRKSKKFLLQLKNCFSAQPRRFQNNDANKITFAVSFLRDSAFDWISPHLDSDDQLMHSWDEFKRSFNTVFGEIDRTRKAEDEIFSLKQNNRPVSAVVSEFQRLALETRMNNEALFPLFYRTLNDEVKDELCKVARPEHIEDYYRLAISIDDRIFERKREKNLWKNYSRTPLAPQKFEDPVPMIIDNSQTRGPLTQQEKLRRRNNNLCLYCGAPEHKIADCPKRSNSGNEKARF